jgi:hypothetical protein
VSRLVLAFAGLLLLGGCGSDDPVAPKRQPPRPVAAKALHVQPARCPPDAANCRAAKGRILYVEAKDPDGDGDAHFVLASAQSISAPGITAIDVERAMRPHPLPRVGDLVSAAGPVYSGSFGQRQIQATVLHVTAAPRPRDGKRR